MGEILVCELCTTVSKETVARLLVDQALSQKLAACVHQRAIKSSYVWQGQREDADEIELVFITSKQLEPLLRDALRGHHPYECPAFYTKDLKNVDEAYLDWLVSSIRSL